MTYPLSKLNLAAQASQMQAIKPVNFMGAQSPSSEVSSGTSSGNPFAQENSYVGLASNNPNLQGVSSNIFGKQNISNTIGIA